MTVQRIRDIFKAKLETEDFVIDRTGVKMIEIINAHFIADEELIFGSPSPEWYNRELAWYNSKSLNVNDIPPPIPKVWQQVADSKGFINSNYGWCIFSEENHNQYDWVVKELKENIYSRRAQMIYTRPSMNKEYNLDGRSDFMCCSNTVHLIRDNKLSSHIYFRSNDAIFGYKGDYFWMNHVHNKLYNDLLETYSNLELGDIHWNSTSLHVYKKHLNFVKDYSNLTYGVTY
jgi:thymidylate synthase